MMARGKLVEPNFSSGAAKSLVLKDFTGKSFKPKDLAGTSS
jgi:hypothetical protein